MKTFEKLREDVTPHDQIEQGLGTFELSEAVHEHIQKIMDSEIDPKQKLNAVTKTARKLIAGGHDTGLEDTKPKKGSSRAVFFPKEHKHIELDGQKVSTPSVVKIAFAGHLDKYNKSGVLLGTHQNKIESDHYINHNYAVIREHPHPDHAGKFVSNEHGILPPHFGHHPEHDHLEMGRVEKVTAKGFKDATKTPDFPKGISHKEFHDAVMHNWASAHGKDHYTDTPVHHLEKLQDHPLVENVNHFVGDTQNHPGDMRPANMGIWHHPVTGKKHVVISDFGYSNEIAKHYTDARREQSRKLRGW